MQLNSINPYQPLNALQGLSESKAHASNNQTPLVSTDTVTISNAAHSKDERAKEIMKDYDLKNISYSSQEEMGGKLRDAGIISDYEFLIELVPPSATLPGNAAKILEGADPRWNPTEPYNMIAHFENILEKQKEFNKDDQKSIEIAQKRIDLAHYLDNLHHKANIEQYTS